jgi:hypothetical protein
MPKKELTNINKSLSELSIKYRYVGPNDSKTRDFCRALLNLNKVYTKDEIEKISKLVGRNVWTKRGGWYTKPGTDIHLPYCRHQWTSIIVRNKNSNKEAPIVKKPITEEDVKFCETKRIYSNNSTLFVKPNDRTINTYTRDGYQVNKLIRKGELDKFDIAYINNLDKSLEDLPNYVGKVFRGIADDGTYSEILKSSIGDEITWNTYTSSSRSKMIANNFSIESKKKKIIFEINSKTGKDIQQLSNFQSEEEVLFVKDTKFRVDKVEEILNGIQVKLTEV